MKKYTIKEVLNYLYRNNIILVNKEDIGEVILPIIDEAFILDDDEDDCIL